MRGLLRIGKQSVMAAGLMACSPHTPPETVACNGVPEMALAGRLTDNGQILSGAAADRTVRAIEGYEKETRRQLVVATVNSLDGLRIDNYAHCLGDRWKIGDAQRNDGIVILLAPTERQVRIATGSGAETMLTDEEAFRAIQAMTPEFQRGEYAAGLENGIGLIAREMGQADAR